MSYIWVIYGLYAGGKFRVKLFRVKLFRVKLEFEAQQCRLH